MSDAPTSRCYRHPDREAAIRCQRCNRTICPACMHEAAVGFQCPECVRAGQVRQPKTIAGAALTSRLGRISLALIAINVVVFIAQLATGGTDSALFRRGAMLGLTAFDPSSGELLRGVADGAYWRLVTSAFLHSGILHIAFNMYALYLFGPFVERILGTTRFILAYLTMAVISSVFVYWLSDPLAVTIGASGAIFGLFGMALILLIRARQDVRMLLMLLAINAVISLQGNISWQGHLGGFAAGVILGAVFAYVPRGQRTLWQIATFTILWLGTVIAVVARSAALL